MWRILLFLYMFSFEAFSRNEDLADKLKKIAQQQDKVVVISQLDELLKGKMLVDLDRVHILTLQGKSYIALNEFEQALRVIQTAKKIAIQKKLVFQQASLDKLSGIIFYYQGQYKEAVNAYQAALNYFKKQPTSAAIAIKKANLLNNIALAQTKQGNSLEALKNYQLADPLYQQYGDEMDKIDIRYNLATLYLSLRRLDIAISMLTEVLSNKIDIGDDYGAAKASAALGVALKHSGQYKKAEENVLNALKYFKKGGNQFDAASQFQNLAEINYELSNLVKAHDYAIKAIEISKKIGHGMTYAGGLHTLAKVFFHLNDLERSLTNIELSNAIAKKMDFQRLINENLGLMSLIFAAERKTGKALEAQLSYQKAHLKLSNETLNEQIAIFESAQLTQQVKNLQQSKKLQQLESTKAEQQRQFIVLGVLCLLVILFLFYRRYLERRLTKELEGRVKKRTEALEFLTKELKEANTIKSQFLANMSHEIRTPLTAVIGQSEAIIYGDVDDVNIQKEVKVIYNNSLHLLQLINDILDLSKIEANKFELENRQQDLHEIVDSLNNIFTKEAERKKLSFSISHQLPSPFIINVDGLRLKQILINLCSNAIKFTSEGWVTLDITIIDKTLFFTVTDTGIGMNESQQAKIFNSFTQAESSINRRFSGSGLGLFLSDQLAKVMLGEIIVTSQLDQGSTFVFKLPFDDSYSSSMLIENHTDEDFYTAFNKKRYSGQIVLADDHDDNRRLIARLLESLGLEVLNASDGKEAIALAIKHKPPLTLLDIQMPEMDGIEALKKLRGLGCTHPIYALTANAMSHEISQYLSMGFDGHLKKPIEREAFLAAIERYYPEKIITEVDQKNFDVTDIKESFIANLSQDKIDILQHSDNQDKERLASAAHKIAGAATMFGYPELSQCALELERGIKSSHLDAVEDLAHCLLDEINLVQHTYKVNSGV
jgi:signal transduction histidine kinase/CheY-like chemotaxis protein/tetratricopeptide (TPR) repeat protein/HPt (histidine-containing phosphotransfer) domain-containing protein